MNLREFLKLYNFRWINQNNKENTGIVRIYTEFPSNWFEFGVNAWNWQNQQADEIIKDVLNKSVLNREVVSLNYDNNNEVFCIYLKEV